MLELKNISYEVDDDNDNKEILKNVNLTIDEHFVAITGPNGGGKSTLARIIAGIHTPTSGQILFNGEDITDLSITETRYQLCFPAAGPFQGTDGKRSGKYCSRQTDVCQRYL